MSDATVPDAKVSDANSDGNSPDVQRQAIAVTHGLGANRLVLYPLCRRLRRLGYHVNNWGYRSFWHGIEYHAERFRKVLLALENDDSIDRFHIVAHSMGNIVTRVALSAIQPKKLNRIVMITPPNRGSPVATMYAPLFGWFSRTLVELADSDDSFVNQIRSQLDPDYEVGVLQAQTDFLVPVEHTQLAEAKEYLMLRGFHSTITLHEDTIRHIHHFLQNGEFAPTDLELNPNLSNHLADGETLQSPVSHGS